MSNSNISASIAIIKENDTAFPTTFSKWVNDNYSIYTAFVRYAKVLREFNGNKRYSARTIIERMRWDTLIGELKGSGATTVKISNNVTPYLSRLSMLENEELGGMFQLKPLTSKHVDMGDVTITDKSSESNTSTSF